jgi:hypothetical protein
MNPIERLAELVEDWKYLLQRSDLKSLLLAVGPGIAMLPYRHLRFFILARSLAEPFPDLLPKISLRIRPFKYADLVLVKDMDRPSEAKLCERRLESGHKGLIALHRDRSVGHAWGCTQVNPNLERVNLQLLSGDVLFTDVFTVPSFRRQGIQTALTLARFQMFGDLGYRRAVSYIEINNAPSLAVWQRKLGSQIIGRIDFRRIGPWYIIRYE